MGEPPVTSDLARRRLRWRARRGLLENDLILDRFLEREGDGLVPADILALEALLDLPDSELLDLLLGRKDPEAMLDNNAVLGLLKRIRAT
jgi:antitoxin CptB